MSDFATGFVTGFANTLADGINERNKVARDYFQKQYEIATTVGLENRRKVSQQVDVSVKTAKQLQQMGVPKDIIMAVASQDPLSLSDFYNDIAKAQANGVPIDQDFFDEFVQVSGDFQAPNEDFYTFFKKALTPITSVVEADPDGFNRDRKGGIFAAMMGADPYGRARKQLDETIVVDGLSASELARYGQDYQPAGVEGAPTVTFDYSKASTKKPDDLSISETTAVNKALEDTAKRIWLDGNTNGNTMSKEEAHALAVEETKKTFSHIPSAVEYLDSMEGAPPESPEGEIEETPLPPSSQELSEAGIGAPQEPVGGSAETVIPPEATTPTEVPTVGPVPDLESVSNDPINPEVENLSNINIKGIELTWYSNNPTDGTVTYIDQNGEEYIFDPAEVRAFTQQYGTRFDP